MNVVSIIGRLVEDPELRYTPNGAAVANFRIAVNNAGAFISEAEGYQAGFFNAVVWGKGAENLCDYCQKGREIAIQGSLSQRVWEDDNGDNHYQIEIIAQRIDFLREPQGANNDNDQNNGRNNRGNGNGNNRGGSGNSNKNKNKNKNQGNQNSGNGGNNRGR